MAKEVVSADSYLTVLEKNESLFPMYFGISCAFFAQKILSKLDNEDEKLSELCDTMLQGSAKLLGLLVWRIQREVANSKFCDLHHKLDAAEKEINDLKQIRREDAKANEKVVGIFASQEQSWFIERKKLRQQIGALMNELRLTQKRKEDDVSEINEKLKEMELLVQSKEKALEEDENKRKELEEKLMKAESIAGELRETAKREAQEYSTDIWKHKTAFLELVSNQRQLEAELGRALRQLDAKRQEINLILEKQEESVLLAQKLSLEVVKTRKDSEQKDKIVSAMLRKSKLDVAEKQMLLKEVKLSKAKRKQAELETERWRVATESKHERHSLRSMFARQANPRADDPSITKRVSQTGKGRPESNIDYVLEYENPEFQNDAEIFTPFSDCYSPEISNELAITTDVKRLEGWVRSEAEKYASIIEKRHHLEIDAFAEQMRLKDEKLEAFRWRMLSMEIESKRLQSHVEGLNQDVSQLRFDNMKLEALLFERQQELNALKEQFPVEVKLQISQKKDSVSSIPDIGSAIDDANVKSVKREPVERDQDTKAELMEMSQEKYAEIEQADPNNKSKNAIFIAQTPDKVFVEEKNIADQVSLKDEKLPSCSQPLMKTNNSPWRVDLHALGVSYKIKRLKQQLLMLERLIGKQESEEQTEKNNGNQNEMKGFQLLMFSLNKQINRYQSLQAKTDELCKRMHDNDTDKSSSDSSTPLTKGETKTLEHFLEETFQLQRYMVATGQKLIEVQSKIASGLVGVPEELDKSICFDTKRFADNMRTVFHEVQRGLEVRIARIIGDLEGTLACEGMTRIRR